MTAPSPQSSGFRVAVEWHAPGTMIGDGGPFCGTRFATARTLREARERVVVELERDLRAPFVIDEVYPA